MNKENAISKVNSIGKAGRVISTILQVILVIGVVCAMIGTIAYLALPKNLLTLTIDGSATVSMNEEALKQLDPNTDFENPDTISSFTTGSLNINSTDYTQGQATIEDGNINFTFQQVPAVITTARLLLITAAAIVYMAISFVMVLFVKKLCKSLEGCSSPFEENIIKELQRCVWFSIPWVLCGGIAGNIIRTAFSSTVNFSIEFSLTTVLIILLLFGLAYIFKYGAVLQQESDETL